MILIVPGGVAAQAVRGAIVDVRDGRPLPGSAVLLTDSAGTIVSASTSDSAGGFYLDAERPGTHILVISRIGFRQTESDFLPLETNRILELQVTMVPLPSVVLDPIEVVANDQPRSTAMRGFLQRRATNVGFSFDLQDIERIVPADIDDLLRWAPGAITRGSGRNLFVTLNFNRCRPSVIVDGRRLAPEFTEDFPMDWVVGVEVFRRRTEVPSEFRRTVDSGSVTSRDCGAVLVWTKWIR